MFDDDVLNAHANMQGTWFLLTLFLHPVDFCFRWAAGAAPFLFAQSDKGMSSGQRQEVLVAADVAAKRLPNMSLEQVKAMCSRLPTDAAGKVSFHELQK